MTQSTKDLIDILKTLNRQKEAIRPLFDKAIATDAPNDYLKVIKAALILSQDSIRCLNNTLDILKNMAAGNIGMDPAIIVNISLGTAVKPFYDQAIERRSVNMIINMEKFKELLNVIEKGDIETINAIKI